MYTFNIEKYTEHYVPNAKSVLVKNFRHSIKDGVTFIKRKWAYDFRLQFNHKGQLLFVNRLGKLERKYTLYYHQNKILKIIETEIDDNIIKSEKSFSYDIINRLILEEELIYSNYPDYPNYSNTFQYKYLNNTCTIKIYYGLNGEKYLVKDILDERGNILESITKQDGVFQHGYKAKYDSNNKFISMTLIEEDGSDSSKDVETNDVYSEQYTYNDNNDWIKEEIYKNNILVESKEREITYY